MSVFFEESEEWGGQIVFRKKDWDRRKQWLDVDEAPCFSVKSVYFTLVVEDEEGNVLELKEKDVITEFKVHVINKLEMKGVVVADYDDGILLNPGTDDFWVPHWSYKNILLFPEDRIRTGSDLWAQRLYDEMNILREEMAEDDDIQWEE